MTTLGDRLAARIERDGALPFSEFVEAALYDEADGFYATGGAAGRRGDFITSPEVGPLFGAVIAHALDAWWRDCGRPDPYRVVECGAGTGTLARAIVAAQPACTGVLEYALVERSDRLRAQHPIGARFASYASLGAVGHAHVVFANELLDNLAFDLVEFAAGGWREVRVATDERGRFVEKLVDAAPELLSAVPATAPLGARAPVQRAAQAWLADALGSAPGGVVMIIDYADATASLATRPVGEWLRTYRAHERGGAPIDAPGTQDITCEVAVDQLTAVRAPTRDRTQAEFLRAHGIDALVDEGRRVWHERAAVGDLAALRARSRVREAEALCDANGLGAYRVLEWQPASAPH